MANDDDDDGLTKNDCVIV